MLDFAQLIRELLNRSLAGDQAEAAGDFLLRLATWPSERD